MSKLSTMSPKRKPGAIAPALRSTPPEDLVGTAMGWGSLGLGLPQAAMPGRFLRLVGIEPTARSRAVLLTLAAPRELAAAAGILALERPRPVRTLWARVAGDVLDIALLASALRGNPVSRARLIGSMGAVAAITAADAFAAMRLAKREREQEERPGPTDVRAAVTIWKPPEEVYGLWRDFRNLPSFMYHLESVETDGDRSSHWKAKAPAGRTVEWDAETVEDRPNELISWRSLPSSSVPNSGTVRFVPAPGGDGTEVHLELHYDPPGGPIGAAVAKLFGEEPRQQVKDDLRRLKQVMETGEVVRSEGTPEGQVATRMAKQRPAHPLPETAAGEGRTS